MLRINLLPPYIYDKQKKIKWVVGSLALVAVTLGVLFWWMSVVQQQLDQEKKRQEEANSQKQIYDTKVAAIKAEQDKIAATKAKQTFVANARTYNDAWWQTYDRMRDLTSPKVLLKSMAVADDHKTINFSGFCQNEVDLVRWWMYLRSTQYFTNVHFNLPAHPYPPNDSNTGGGAPSGFGGGGGARSGGGGGPSLGLNPGYGSGPPSGMGGGPGSAGPKGGFGGTSFGGGGGGRQDAVGPEEIEGRKGISFTAAATMKTALAGGIPVPTWPPGGGGGGNAGPAGPGGGFGSMGGPGGSFGGSAGGGGPKGGGTRD